MGPGVGDGLADHRPVHQHPVHRRDTEDRYRPVFRNDRQERRRIRLGDADQKTAGTAMAKARKAWGMPSRVMAAGRGTDGMPLKSARA